jgi:hypothetical protein
MTIDRTVLNGNTAKVAGTGTSGGASFEQVDGGAIISYGAASIRRSVLSSNRSIGSASNDFASGGAISNYFAPLTITSSTIIGNSTTAGLGAADGGGVLSGGTGASLTVTDSLVIGNKATAPAGAAPAGGCVPATSSTSSGGGIYVISGTATISSSIVSGNAARATGGCGTAAGGGYFNGRATGTLTAVKVVGNSVVADTGHGGGIAASTRAVALHLDHTNVTANTVTGTNSLGGGLYLPRATTVFTSVQSHITSNRPDDCAPAAAAILCTQ